MAPYEYLLEEETSSDIDYGRPRPPLQCRTRSKEKEFQEQQESKLPESKATFLPWWFYVGAAYVLMNLIADGRHKNLFKELRNPWQIQNVASNSLRGRSERPDQRRLEDHLVTTISSGGFKNITGSSTEDAVNVTVPCLGWYAYKSDDHAIGYGGILSPCGTFPIAREGVRIYYPMGGSFVIPAKDKLHKWAGKVDAFALHWAWAFLFGFFVIDVIWHMLFYYFPSIQPDFFDEINDLWTGNLAPPDSFLTPEEVADWNAARMEYDSNEFKVRGNIFRVLAVFEPRDPNVGWYRWSQYVVRGLLCAFMQIYLPISMITQTMMEWKFRGPKSVFWLTVHAGEFAIMFVALAELASIFFSKARSHLIRSAKANNFILSHRPPYRGNKGKPEDYTPASPANPEAEALMESNGPDPAAGSSPPPQSPRVIGLPEDLAKSPEWALGDRLFLIQQYFWCIISMTINFVMSLLLPLVFLLKAATYTGDASGIVVEITALYFIFDLDGKIMESDSSLQTRFRYVIKRQKAMGLRPESERPQLMTRVIGVTQLVMDFSVKYLLLFALATAWEGNGQIIGGNPF